MAKPRALAALAGLVTGLLAGHAAPAEPAAKSPDAATKLGDTSMVTVAGLVWYTDYFAVYRAAKQAKRMLLIYFAPLTESGQQQSIEQFIASNPALRTKLSRVERARLPLDAEIIVDGKPQRLVRHKAFAELRGGAGFALVDLRHAGTSHYGHTVSVLPFASGKYYRWRNENLGVILDLPPGTLTQRTMIWAVRIHPENPASTHGDHHPILASGATKHSKYQASIGVQGHHHFDSRYHQLSRAAGGSVSEVVAESWPGQDLIDSCIDCVACWRHSPGHWRGVSRRHRAFGFDIRRGRNGIWYGTGIFAD
jgi:hypothetical protein